MRVTALLLRFYVRIIRSSLTLPFGLVMPRRVDLKTLFISTNRGVFVERLGVFRRLSFCGGYGVCVASDLKKLILVQSWGNYCFVFEYRIIKLGEHYWINPFSRKLIFILPSNSFKDRIHQIGLSKDGLTLVCALTSRNSILKVNLERKEYREIQLFSDCFGMPILSDHNHVNGVRIVRDGIVVTCHSFAESSSVVLVLSGDLIEVFEIKSRGVHDFFVDEKECFVCDSFVNGKVNVGISGELLSSVRGSIPLSDKVDGLPGSSVIRGICRDSLNQWIIGVSHYSKAERQVRNNGTWGAGVIVIESSFQKAGVYRALPASQVFDCHMPNYDSNDVPVSQVIDLLNASASFVSRGNLEETSGFITPLRIDFVEEYRCLNF